MGSQIPAPEKEVSQHYRDPLLKLCETDGPISTSAVRHIAPQLFIRLVQDPVWRDILLSPQTDPVVTLKKVVSLYAQDPAFQAQRDCEARIFQDVFPKLHSQLTSQQNITEEVLEQVMNTTKSAVARSVGSPMDAAHSFNKLQAEVIDSEEARVDATKLVEELVSSTQVLLQHSMETTSGPDGQVQPPNNGKLSARTEKYAGVNYDEFSRQALTVVKINSGLLIFMCYATAAYEMYQLLQRDPDGQFIMREQLRTGKHGIVDTSLVERSPIVGGSTIVQGSEALDMLLYGANYPMRNKIAIPGQLDSKNLRIMMLKGEDKILYQTLSPEGRHKFSALFGHLPAESMFEGDLLGLVERPNVSTDKKTGFYTHFPEAVAADNVKQALYGQIGEETNTKADARVTATTAKDIGGFTGSLRMKILRLALDAKSGNGDMVSRRLKLDVMKSARLVSIEDIVSLLFFIETGPDADAGTKITELTEKLMAQVQENIDLICYYKGNVSSDIFQRWAKTLDLAVANEGAGVEGCPNIEDSSTSQIFIRLSDVEKLGCVSEVSSAIDSASGLTPGQQLKLSQINSASRIDNVFTSIYSMAKINLSLTIVSYLKDTWTVAGRLYELSNSACDTRDPDEMALFWGVPMPGPACPKLGIAYFPKWIDWLANNGGHIQFLAADAVGTTVEYQCYTGVQPDPETRQIYSDNNPSEVRLSGTMPTCVPTPSAYTCFYRDSPYGTRSCPHSLTHVDNDVLPGGLEWSDDGSGTKTAEFKSMFRFKTDDVKEGFRCTSYASIDLTSEPEYNVYSLKEACPPGQKDCVDTHKDKSCQEICDFEVAAGNFCGAYYVTTVDAVQLCHTLRMAVFPISQVTDSSSVVCYRDTGLRLQFLNAASETVAELRLQNDGYQVMTAETRTGASFNSDQFVTAAKYRYLHFALTQEDVRTASSVTTTITLRVIPMYREVSSPDEQNFKWFKSSSSLDIPLFQGTEDPGIVHLGLGCDDRGQIRDLCYRRTGHDDEFVYPSESFDAIYHSAFSMSTQDRPFASNKPSALLAMANVQIEGATTSSEPTKEQSMWEKIEEVVWSDEVQAKVNQLPHIGQSMLGFHHETQRALESMLEWAPLQSAAKTMGLEEKYGSFVSSLKSSGSELPEMHLSQLVDTVIPAVDSFTKTVRESGIMKSAQALADKLTEKISGRHTSHANLLQTQTLFQDSVKTASSEDSSMSSFPTTPKFETGGPVKATGTLLMLYVLGCMGTMVFFLIKNHDRVDKGNNVGVRDYQMFNPAIALLPNGQYAQQYGSSAQAQMYVLVFVVLASMLSVLRLVKFTGEKGMEANEVLYGSA